MGGVPVVAGVPRLFKSDVVKESGVAENRPPETSDSGGTGAALSNPRGRADNCLNCFRYSSRDILVVAGLRVQMKPMLDTVLYWRNRPSILAPVLSSRKVAWRALLLTSRTSSLTCISVSAREVELK